ncbi:hypothetical protein DKX38_006873 [Salix brachista]|uniref:Uncharacterized protein n=1 Tax=Salix brachista TaxID=2182728 RepID=A0A5N5MLM0_9ROSI|nr:hypothetical protein DKX38_006873 [Salix brachista]
MARGNSSRNFSLQSMKPLPTSEIKAKEETQIEVIHLASIVAEQAIHHSNAGKGLMQSVTSLRNGFFIDLFGSHILSESCQEGSVFADFLSCNRQENVSLDM